MLRHPYDLSGGEQQRAALAKVLLLEPEILLLDEPTKGLDAEFKQIFAGILEKLLHRGVTILMVSHDIEFCAKYAHRCALFFDGSVVTEETPRAFFSGNSFYTTSANRMARHLLPEAVTAEDVICACGGSVPEEKAPPDGDFSLPAEPAQPEEKRTGLPLWRKLVATASGALVIAAAVIALTEPDIPWLTGGGFGLYSMLIAAGVILALAVSRKSDRPIEFDQVPRERRKLSRRTVAAAVMILLAIPLTLYVGVYFFGDRKYYFISHLVIL